MALPQRDWDRPPVRAVPDAGGRPVDAVEEGSAPPSIVVVNRFPAGEVARAVLVVLGVMVGAYLLWRVQEVVVLLFLAILLATAIEPIVNYLRRGPFTRGSGVLIVYTAIVVAVGLPIYLVAPQVLTQAVTFTEQLPGRLEDLRPLAIGLQPRPLSEAAIGGIDQAEGALRSPPTPPSDRLVEAGATAAHTLVSFITVFVLALYWLLERATLKRVLLRAVAPRWAREVNTIWLEVEEKLGGWVRGQLLLMLAVALMAAVAFLLLDLPNPALLAVAAGLSEIVPMLGPFIAFAPAVLVALAIDPSKAIVVVVAAIVIQQIESNILVPRVMGHTVGVSPLTILLGILIGSTIAGLPGAFLAVPVAGAVQVILAHVFRVEDSSQAEEHPTPASQARAQSGAAGTAPPAAPPA